MLVYHVSSLLEGNTFHRYTFHKFKDIGNRPTKKDVDLTCTGSAFCGERERRRRCAHNFFYREDEDGVVVTPSHSVGDKSSKGRRKELFLANLILIVNYIGGEPRGLYRIGDTGFDIY